MNDKIDNRTDQQKAHDNLVGRRVPEGIKGKPIQPDNTPTGKIRKEFAPYAQKK